MNKMSRRDFGKRLFLGAAGITAMGNGILPLSGMTKNISFQEGRKPNFVFICSDQHGYKYNGFAGHPFIKTPNLDKIAQKGVVFNSNYTGNPVCAPGRSSMMTGMYSSDTNSFCNSTVYDGTFPTWGKMLRDSGYYCWATGKQDMNPDEDMGFVEVNVDHGHASRPDITSLFRRPAIYRMGERESIDGKARESRNRDEEDMKAAVDFLKKDSAKLDKPWVCYVGFHEPHPDFTGLRKYYDEYLQKTDAPEVPIEELEGLPLAYQEMRNFKRISTPIPSDRIKRTKAAYFAMISELDEYIGKVYDAVEESGQLDNTIFIYTSDHGESLGEHGMWLKNNLYDCASRVPLVISGPDIPKGKIIDEPTGHIDLVASMMEWACLTNAKHLRGTSLTHLINGDKSKAPGFAYTESHSEGNPTGSCMIRVGNWKLMHFSYYEDCLFNLKDDPGEKHNLAPNPKYKEKTEELRKILYSRINPEEITDRAFNLQDTILKKIADSSSHDELFNLLKSRLGPGQAEVISRKLKNRSFPQ